MICSIAGVEWLKSGVWVTELMLVLLMVAYFFFMATEAVLVNMSSRVLEIVEVRSDVLVDFLVAHSSPLERLYIITMLVGEAAPAREVIRSRGGGSANRAHRI